LTAHIAQLTLHSSHDGPDGLRPSVSDLQEKPRGYGFFTGRRPSSHGSDTEDEDMQQEVRLNKGEWGSKRSNVGIRLLLCHPPAMFPAYPPTPSSAG
jgi:hypothetical protein